MLKSVCRLSTALLIALSLLASVPSLAVARARRYSPPRRSDAAQDKSKDKKEKKDKKDDKDEEDKPSKQERKYQEIKRFSDDLYAKDQEFHDDVEEAYRQKQREHSELAYQMNTRTAGDERAEKLVHK